MQVVVGLLTDSRGEPISTQVYRGNTSDLKTFGAQIRKVKTSWAVRGSRRLTMPALGESAD
jgi:transposase